MCLRASVRPFVCLMWVVIAKVTKGNRRKCVQILDPYYSSSFRLSNAWPAWPSMWPTRCNKGRFGRDGPCPDGDDAGDADDVDDAGDVDDHVVNPLLDGAASVVVSVLSINALILLWAFNGGFASSTWPSGHLYILLILSMSFVAKFSLWPISDAPYR